MRCPDCGKFVHGTATVVMDEIVKVEADCAKCGPVEPDDWIWEDFFPDPTIHFKLS